MQGGLNVKWNRKMIKGQSSDLESYWTFFVLIAFQTEDFFLFSWARWTALVTTPSTRWQSAGQLGDQQSNAAAGLKATLRVGHFNV